MSNSVGQTKKQQASIVPLSWPGAFKLYDRSRQAMMVNISTFATIFVLSIVVGFIPALIDQHNQLYYLLYISATIVSIWFEAAMMFVVLASVQRRKIALNDSLQKAWAVFGRYFLQSLLIGLIALGAILCLIIPAFIILPRLILAPYYLLDKNLGIVESIKASWETTRGHAKKIWGIIGVNVLMALPILTFIGIPVSIYLIFMYSAANGILYFWLIKQQSSQSAVSETAK